MKRLLSLLAALLLCLPLAACGGGGLVVRYDIPNPVLNLDPQFATDAAARMVISNTFEGLFRQLPSGEVVPCLAERYEVAEDGLTYTFYLRRDAKWSGNGVRASSGGWAAGRPVTAHDFAFALSRMFDREAQSPFAGEFSSLKNAGRILAGELSAGALGVRALDDYTLRIQLDRPDNLLPERLAASYAMPCQREFFQSTMARYGLDLESLLFNGPFYLRSWTDAALSLRQNPAYASGAPAAALGADLYVTQGDPEARFLGGVTDAAKVSFAGLPAVREAGARVTSFEDTVWVLLCNNDLDRSSDGELNYFANPDIRRAVAHAVDRERLSEGLPANLRATRTLVPPSVFFLGWPYRTLAGEDSPVVSSAELAKRYYATGLEDLGLDGLPSQRLLVCEDYGQPLLAGYVQQGLSSALSLYAGLEVVDRAELERRVASGNFQLAIYPLSASYSSPDAIFSYFRSDAGVNPSAYRDEAFDALLSGAATLTGGDQLAAYEQAEDRLLGEGAAIPLYFETSYYAEKKGITGIAFSPFLSGVYFKDASKN